MKKTIINILVLFSVSIFTGCSYKNTDLVQIKPNLKNLTKRANSAIERRGITIEKMDLFLKNKYPILMENFKDYDLKYNYKNGVTVVLLCEDNQAVYEDLSCDVKIDKDYSGKNLECDFQIKQPKCIEE